MARGIVVTTNRPKTHGVIERMDDGSHNLYQMNIVQSGFVPTVNQEVEFTPNGMKAEEVQPAVPAGDGGGV